MRAKLEQLGYSVTVYTYPPSTSFPDHSHADITMFGDVALAMLKMMWHSATVPGAILASDVPAALSKLTAASEAEKEAYRKHKPRIHRSREVPGKYPDPRKPT